MKHILKITFLLFINISFAQSEVKIENIEGFYISGDETSVFMEINKNNSVTSNWAEFEKGIEIEKEMSQKIENANLRGVYMRINATKRTGKSFGHLGTWKSEVLITKVLEVDSTKNFQKFIRENKVKLNKL